MITEKLIWIIIGVIVSAGSQFVLDLGRHLTFFIHWDYEQKRKWMERHHKAMKKRKLTKDEKNEIRRIAYVECDGKDLERTNIIMSDNQEQNSLIDQIGLLSTKNQKRFR